MGRIWLEICGGEGRHCQQSRLAKITHFTYYALFPVKPLTADDYRPKEKIITPAQIDNKNDFATFDGLGDEFEIRIYDITGRLVRLLNQTVSSGPKWDGKDGAWKFGSERRVYLPVQGECRRRHEVDKRNHDCREVGSRS